MFKTLCMCILPLVGAALFVHFSDAAAEDQAGPQRHGIPDHGVQGGLAIQIGCDRTEELAALGKDGRFLVQAFSDNDKSIALARQVIADENLSDRVWVSAFDNRNLPFADNVANLVIAAENSSVSMDEIMRVLAPRGVALVGGQKLVKPVPADIDQWTHHLHDASGNAVSRDSVAGPPRHLQWAATPLWSKHHNATANVNAMVSAQGRVFSICEESPVSIDPAMMPDQWSLVARDAFNGILLWRVPISLWGTRAWNPANPHGRNNQPTHIGRRLVAVGDRVYVTLGYNAPVSELDAATGEVVRVLEGTQFTDAILCENDKLILVINKGPQAASRRDPPVRKEIAVLDRKSGKTLWRKGDYLGLQSKTGDMDRINHLTVAVRDDRMFFFSSREEIVCLSTKDGKTLWKRERPLAKAHEMRYELRVTDRCTLIAHEGILLLAQPEPTKRFDHKKGMAKIYAFAADTGAPLWNRAIAQWGWAEPPDVYIIKDEVWLFDLASFSLLAFDPKTGEELRRWKTAEALDKSHHHRCYRNRSSENFVWTSHRGIELFDLQTGENSLNPFVRGACQFGFLPCNGLLYTTPHPCVCFIDGKLNGMLALAPADTGSEVAQAGRTERLVNGPAYARVAETADAPDSEAWPTYRHDIERSGSTETELPTTLQTRWTTTIQGEPTACVIGEGKVLLASKQARRLYAFDEETGTPLWDRVLSGSMDSPPTLYRGTALCGGRDGWVTCLRLEDGEVVWRFRATPNDRWIHAYGSLESASPVFGSVLVKNDTAYFTAGRSSYLDGGIYAFGLDPKTGTVKERRHLATEGESTTACLADILVSSGDSVFMRNTAVFGPPQADRNFLFSLSGMLDEAWFNRAPWNLGRETKGANYGFPNSKGPLTGQYLVHDNKSLFGVVAASSDRDRGIFKPATVGYRLHCAEVDPESTKAEELWSMQVGVRIMAMVNTPAVLFAAGTPDVVDSDDPWGALAGRKGGRLLVISKEDGVTMSSTALPAAPCLDGLAAANGRLFVVLKNGQLICME